MNDETEILDATKIDIVRKLPNDHSSVKTKLTSSSQWNELYQTMSDPTQQFLIKLDVVLVEEFEDFPLRCSGRTIRNDHRTFEDVVDSIECCTLFGEVATRDESQQRFWKASSWENDCFNRGRGW